MNRANEITPRDSISPRMISHSLFMLAVWRRCIPELLVLGSQVGAQQGGRGGGGGGGPAHRNVAQAPGPPTASRSPPPPNPPPPRGGARPAGKILSGGGRINSKKKGLVSLAR